MATKVIADVPPWVPVSDRHDERAACIFERTYRGRRRIPDNIWIENRKFRKITRDLLAIKRTAAGYELRENALVEGLTAAIIHDGKLFRPQARYLNQFRTYAPHIAETDMWNRLKRNKADLEVPRAIILRHPYEDRYIHFLADMLPGLIIADQLGIGDLPILVGTRLWNMPFFQYLRRNVLAGRQIIVQRTRDIARVNKAYLLYPGRGVAEFLIPTAEQIPAERPGVDPGEKLVLIRNLDVTNARPMDGYSALATELTDLGYSPLDPATLSIGEQKYVFSRASRIVSEYGAGLINMMFCQPADSTFFDTLILEDHLSPTFPLVAASLGVPVRFSVVASNAQAQRQATPMISEEARRAIITTARADRQPPRNTGWRLWGTGVL